MIEYNPKLWTRIIFQFGRSDTMRQLLPAMLGFGAYAAVITFLESEVVHIHFKSTSIIHSLLGFVLSLLLVFRTNGSYDRWWEGRKLWGALVNVSRNLQLKTIAIMGRQDREAVVKMDEWIPLYAVSLKNHLRNKKTESHWLKAERHQPNQVATLMFGEINAWLRNGQITEIQYLTLNQDINQFTDICGACERIKNTPIPYSYSSFIKKFIFIYMITMPFSFVEDFKYTLIPVLMFVFYALGSLELLAEEIENPFGNDDNDLPLDALCQTIKKSVGELTERWSTGLSHGV